MKNKTCVSCSVNSYPSKLVNKILEKTSKLSHSLRNLISLKKNEKLKKNKKNKKKIENLHWIFAEFRFHFLSWQGVILLSFEGLAKVILFRRKTVWNGMLKTLSSLVFLGKNYQNSFSESDRLFDDEM